MHTLPQNKSSPGRTDRRVGWGKVLCTHTKKKTTNELVGLVWDKTLPYSISDVLLSKFLTIDLYFSKSSGFEYLENCITGFSDLSVSGR